MPKPPAKIRVNTLRELDALVGDRVIGEVPEVYWEDAHGTFRFETEQEAIEAMKRLRAQPNLPTIDWESMAPIAIKSYRFYSSEITSAWMVVEKIGSSENQLRIRRDRGLWHVAFGLHVESIARSAPVAICVAGLRAVSVEIDYDPDVIH